jgi:hypothetical protein
MVKAYCVVCGAWENVHADGKCHRDHYGHDEGRAFVQGAATPEEVARVRGIGATELVDVEFPAQTGDYAAARRREADERERVVRNEPILGKLTGEGEAAEGGNLNRVSPAGRDAEDRREAPNKALPSEVEAMLANVKGMQRDVEEMEEPRKVSEVDPAEAGDADLKQGVERAVAKDRKATDKTAERNREERAERERDERALQEREARAAQRGPATTQTRADAAKK